jgi:hypothetical protein
VSVYITASVLLTEFRRVAIARLDARAPTMEAAIGRRGELGDGNVLWCATAEQDEA